MIPNILNKFEYAGISIPMAVLIWIMIYPMMIKVDFKSVKYISKNPKGLFVTWIVNWLIKPFTMYGIACLFFFVLFRAFIPVELATEYLAGAVLLGAAPCTAMVFVWSSLTQGNPVYTVVQVATNDIIILFAFGPIVKFLLGVSNVAVPFNTIFLSVVLFVVIPLVGGIITRMAVIRKHDENYLNQQFLNKFDSVTTIGLLLTLVLIFMFQSEVILKNPIHIILIAIPLIIQTFLIFGIAYVACYLLKLPHNIAAPAGMIGASNFFELAVAVAIALFGTTSEAALATTVGVLTEVIQKQVMEDDVTKVEISKTDITGDTEIEGAKLTITDENGNIVETWTSGKEPHYIEKLPIGKYTLKEEQAPNGYVVSEEITFEVADTAEIQKVAMKDDTAKGRLIIEKTDKDTGAALKGAEFELRDADGKVVETLTTDENGHATSGLLAIGTYKDGKFDKAATYYLVETKAPEGYQLDETKHEVTFTYVDDKTPVVEVIQKVTNEKLPEDTPSVSNPKTGDDTNLWIPALCLILSTGGLIGMGVASRRKKKKGGR